MTLLGENVAKVPGRSGDLPRRDIGEVAEWSNAAASKVVVPLVGTGGSNPSLTAMIAGGSNDPPRPPAAPRRVPSPCAK